MILNDQWKIDWYCRRYEDEVVILCELIFLIVRVVCKIQEVNTELTQRQAQGK